MNLDSINVCLFVILEHSLKVHFIGLLNIRLITFGVLVRSAETCARYSLWDYFFFFFFTTSSYTHSFANNSRFRCFPSRTWLSSLAVWSKSGAVCATHPWIIVLVLFIFRAECYAIFFHPFSLVVISLLLHYFCPCLDDHISEKMVNCATGLSFLPSIHPSIYSLHTHMHLQHCDLAVCSFTTCFQTQVFR